VAHTRVAVSSAVQRTPRVLQMEGLFAVPPSARVDLAWDVALPLEEKPWAIGLIVGASGSGKSTVAKALWPAAMAKEFTWDATKSVLDAFPAAMGVKEIVDLLSSVGFSDPPSWVRPFQVLSTGEQFRVGMARRLAEHVAGGDPIVVDEFTSVVDRTVAQIGSAAIARTIRKRTQQLIAVTCHEDVEAWLQPDWIYRPGLNTFDWRALQRPPALELRLARVHHRAWTLFRHHHYLDTDLNTSAVCFVAFWQDRPVAFVAALSFPHPIRPGWRLHRLVCLPDFQGVGIGVALADSVSAILRATGRPVFRVAAHPAVVAHCARSTAWKTTRAPGFVNPVWKTSVEKTLKRSLSRTRLTAGFEYVGPIAPVAQVAALLPEWAARSEAWQTRHAK